MEKKKAALILLIDFRKFFDSIDLTFLHNSLTLFGKLDDHWADLLGTHLNTSPNTRYTILKFGPERFNKLISKKIPGLVAYSYPTKHLNNN